MLDLLVGWTFAGCLNICWLAEDLLVVWTFVGWLNICGLDEHLLVDWTFVTWLNICWLIEDLLVGWTFAGCLNICWLVFIYLHGEFKASAKLLRLLLGWKKKHKNVWHIHTQQYLQISNAIRYKDTYWWTIFNTWTLRTNLPWDNTWKTNHYMTNIYE